MRIVLQRVSEAAVAVVEDGGAEREVGRIGVGLLALVGFASGDSPEALAALATKIADLRLFPGAGGEFDRSLRDGDGGILLVSQFTLYGDSRKGRRPDFSGAAPSGEAESLYNQFCELCRTALPGRVAAGVFGARMRVALVNDGPVTLWLER